MIEVQNLFQNITVFNYEINLAFLLIVFTTTTVIFSILVFYFYRLISKKNILKLDLYQYNQYENPTMIKVVAGFFYLLEYIIVVPILIFVWFVILSVFLLALSTLDAGTTLIICTVFITSARVLSYINQKLSAQFSRTIPFAFLIVAFTSPNFFNLTNFFQKIYSIPSIFPDILYVFVFIIIIEIIMRVSDFTATLFEKNSK